MSLALYRDHLRREPLPSPPEVKGPAPALDRPPCFTSERAHHVLLDIVTRWYSRLSFADILTLFPDDLLARLNNGLSLDLVSFHISATGLICVRVRDKEGVGHFRPLHPKATLPPGLFTGSDAHILVAIATGSLPVEGGR